MLLAAITLSGNTATNAAIVVAWDVNGINVSSGIGVGSGPLYSFAATTADANASGTLSLGSGVNPSTAASSYGFKITNTDAQTTLAGAISNDHYFDFTVSINPGYKLDLLSIDMNAESSMTGSNFGALMTSIDGFADRSEIMSVAGVAGDTGGFDSDSSGFGAIDLSGSEYQGIRGSVSFRVYGFGTSAASSTGATSLRNLSGNDLAINGTLIAVPEPNPTMALIGCALAIAATRRHRRWQSKTPKPPPCLCS